MCGIAGQLKLDGSPVDRRLVERMTHRLVHRGPDDAGFYFGPQVGLGHRRLSIIDLHSGRQPMSDDSGSLHLISNNEIYNFRELREELAKDGTRFATQSDTEVILALYARRRERSVEQLEGMFAFAIWDDDNQTLFLARDRFGVKPLYYYHDDSTFIFASELKALLEYPALDRQLDVLAMDQYFARLALPEPRTIFKKVRKLPAGHFLTVRSGDVHVERYWQPRFRPAWKSVRDLRERLHEELQRSVAISLRSDVPVGLLLSGGLDSSTIAAFATKSGDRLHAFSASFREPEFDESIYSRLVARRFGMRHHQVVVTRNKATDIAARLASTLDEPFADSSSIAMHAVCGLAREHVKTVLGGDGADELLGGYGWHSVHPGPQEPGEVHPSGAIFNRTARAALYSTAWVRELERLRARARTPRTPRLSPLNASLHADLHNYLPSDILFKCDRVSMLHSLELRVPFLNHRLAEFLMRLPEELKVDGANRKVLLRRLMSGILPPEVLERPKKGFSIPMDLWLWERGRWRDMVYDVIFSERTRQRGHWNMKTLERLQQEHDRLDSMHGYQLWTVFMFEMWQRTFLDS